MPYAYVCTRCHHLASRHHLIPGAESVMAGPYRCSHHECDCEIDQTVPLTGISEQQFNASFAGRLTEYINREEAPD